MSEPLPANIPSCLCGFPGVAFGRFVIAQMPPLICPKFIGRVWGHGCHQTLWIYRVWGHGCHRNPKTVELYHRLKVSARRRNTPKSAQSRSRSLCSGLWVPCRIFWAWFGPALGPNTAWNRSFPAGSLRCFGALLSAWRFDSFLMFFVRGHRFRALGVDPGPGEGLLLK